MYAKSICNKIKKLSNMNKKIKILILTLLFAVPGIFAQTVEIEKKYDQFQGTVSVSLWMWGFTGASGDVGAITLWIDVPAPLLNLQNVTNIHPDLIGIEVNYDSENKILKLGWFNANGVPEINSKVLDMVFYYQGATLAPVNFTDPTNHHRFRITNTDLQNIPAGAENGYVSPSPAGYQGKLFMDDIGAFVGSSIDVPVQIQELILGQLQQVNSITLLLHYDHTKLQFQSITSNPYGFSISGQTPGEISIIWSSVTPFDMSGPLTLLDLRFGVIQLGTSEIVFAPGTTVSSNFITKNMLVDGAEVVGANARVKVFLQGFYTGSGQMRKAQGLDGGVIINQFSGSIADEITIELHTPGSYGDNPYVFTGINLHQDGYAYFAATGLSATNYYVTVKHRNHLETVSATPVNFSFSGITYDFTTAASQAYGNNQKTMSDGKFAIFAGDVTGASGVQDGNISQGDMIRINADIRINAQGYLVTDVNGDGQTTMGDIVLYVLNNVRNGVQAKTP
jgi:hypothetical protein